MSKVLITPRSYMHYADKLLPLFVSRGLEPILNRLGTTYTEEEMCELLSGDVIGIIVGLDPLTDKVLHCAKNLKAISKYGVGVDNINLTAAEKQGIAIRTAANTNVVSVAELALALMFSLARNIVPLVKEAKKGGWPRKAGIELSGKKLGILGCGNIGKELALRAKALMMDVLIYDPFLDGEDFLLRNGFERMDSLDDILPLSDVVSLHMPLSVATRDLINADTIYKMKDRALLINTSRGGLINEGDLYAALKSGKLGGAAADVFSNEPPEKGEKLLGLENFILTPHTGANTFEAVARMAEVSTQNLIEMLALQGLC